MKASGVMYLKLHDRFGESAVATAWVFSLFTTFLLMMGKSVPIFVDKTTWYLLINSTKLIT